MDSKVTLDNEPSIKVDIKVDGEKSWLRLSSVWGSYTIEAEKRIKKGDIAEFYCPHCSKSLNVTSKCETCGAPKIELNLNSGGKVSICSRRGCRRHAIEIDNVKDFLRIANDQYKFGGTYEENEPVPSIKAKPEVTKKVFINSFCPHCKKSLIEDNVKVLKIVNESGEAGMLYLSPYLNIFTHRSDVELSEGLAVKDAMCPSCGKSLVDKNVKCKVCNAPVVRIDVKAMNKVFPFDLCSRKGCKWHGIKEEDLKLMFLEDSDEW
jgi:hypothetical protein